MARPACFPKSFRRFLQPAWLVLSLIALAAPLPAQESNDKPRVRVGVLTDNYPHSFVENNQPPAGFAVDMLAAVERTMGLQCEHVVGDTAQITAAFSAGRLDMLQSLAQSSEREKTTDFSVPYLTMTGYIFKRQDAPAIKHLEDLRGRKVLVHPGSLGERILISAGLSNCIVHVPSVKEAFVAISEGRGDATLAAELTGLMMVSQLRLGNVVTTGEPLPGFQVRYSFAVREGDRELLAKINEGLAIIERTGEAERIYRKWFNRVDPRGYSALEITLVIAGGLALALAVAVWGIWRQHTLRQRIARQAERLRASEEEYRGIFELSLFGLILVSAEGDEFVLERINSAALRLLGQATPPLRGTSLRQAFPGEGDFLEKIRAHLAAPTAPEEFEHARPNHSGAACLRVAASRIGPRVQIILADVTVAKQAEERLRQQDQQLRQAQKLEAIGTLSSGIAHDFNNILSSILGNCELIRMELPPDGLLTECNNEVFQAADRARKLVRQILSFCRHADAKREVIELTSIVKETVRFLRSVAPSPIEIRHRAEAAGNVVEADATQIHQVLMNLGTNAVQSMRGQTGLLEVLEELVLVGPEEIARHPQLRMGEFLRISVRDTGCGMTPDVMQRVFDPFFTTKAPGEGTGLGLAVVHGVMQSHRGAITVFSQPGQGSVFQLYFPITVRGVGLESELRQQKPPRGQGEKVLFIDDEESIRRMAEQLLRRLGYQVTGYSDVQVALSEFERHPGDYDIVLTDLTMPHMSGLDLTDHIRKIRPDMPVAVASGFLGESDLSRAQALQVTQLLDKPITLNNLAIAMAACLQSTPKTRR